MCLCIDQTHRCTAPRKVEEGVRTVSLRHLVQHRQELDSMSWLRGEKIQSDFVVLIRPNVSYERHRGRIW